MFDSFASVCVVFIRKRVSYNHKRALYMFYSFTKEPCIYSIHSQKSPVYIRFIRIGLCCIHSQKKPRYIVHIRFAQESNTSTKEPCVSTKEPCVSTKEPCVSTKEPCVSTKEPCVSAKGAYIPTVLCERLERGPAHRERSRASGCLRHIRKRNLDIIPITFAKETDKSTCVTYSFATEPCISAKESCISTKEPCVSAKESCVSAKEPCISAKEPCVSQKSPVYLQKSPVFRQRVLCICKRA